ncbi:MAG: 2,3,4,5-tetrahydropyridine-2,6-dicarboxylate N-succinyltransferase [Gemmatimonadaceae bacterium]|jgi:2,3,4,5-tetrahydropyridine-2-carboxylate N-succinyltransferase|nr:2,3,4,5-tetrahydropyridine-2,6-dicarboxylate N-succinyltransferase [Gemmatimonadaceae bacterium]
MLSLPDLAFRLDTIAATPAGEPLPADTEAVTLQLLHRLEKGEVRAAARAEDGGWTAVPWVKRGILLAFRVGHLVDMSPPGAPHGEGGRPFHFIDKHTFRPRRFEVADGVRIVPGGSAIRRGAHVARGVVCMPPMYINVGAWVDEGTMVDSHALVGSCAQIGRRVHLSAAAQIGGVLEPVNASPVVIEDDVVVGGGCGVYEGTIVRSRAVLGAGVILTRATRVYDLVHERVLSGSASAPLEIPAAAVVVPGARALKGTFAAEHGLSAQTPLIVKYRDDKTDASTALEAWLR